MSPVRTVTSATVVEKPSTAGRTGKHWLLNLECGHTEIRSVKYRPLPGPEGRKGQVLTRDPADARPHPAHVPCDGCRDGVPVVRAGADATLTFTETEAADTAAGGLVSLAALTKHRPEQAVAILDYTSDGLNPAARELAGKLAGTPDLAAVTEQLAALRATHEALLEACADAGHGHTPLQSAHRVPISACPLCRAIRGTTSAKGQWQ